jgi:hypothetical protein
LERPVVELRLLSQFLFPPAIFFIRSHLSISLHYVVSQNIRVRHVILFLICNTFELKEFGQEKLVHLVKLSQSLLHILKPLALVPGFDHVIVYVLKHLLVLAVGLKTFSLKRLKLLPHVTLLTQSLFFDYLHIVVFRRLLINCLFEFHFRFTAQDVFSVK